jgi:hypothetical protein
MFGRAKLNLFTAPEDVGAALATRRTVQAELDLTDAGGRPRCASIAPQLIRWSIDGPRPDPGVRDRPASGRCGARPA